MDTGSNHTAPTHLLEIITCKILLASWLALMPQGQSMKNRFSSDRATNRATKSVDFTTNAPSEMITTIGTQYNQCITAQTRYFPLQCSVSVCLDAIEIFDLRLVFRNLVLQRNIECIDLRRLELPRWSLSFEQ